MKKSTLAIGVIGILGLSYVGIAWHTGNVIEDELDNTLKNLTKQANSLQDYFELKIIHSDDKKGIFSTKSHIKITAEPLNGSESSITLYDDDIVIHHGPFPIAALKQGTFSPQMASIEYQTTQQSNPDLWKLAGNQPFVNGQINLSYSDDMTINLTTKPIVFTDEDFNKKFLEGKLELGKINYKVSIKYLESTPSSVSFSVDNLNYKRHDGNELKINNFKVSNEFNYQNGIFESKNSVDDLVIDFKTITRKPAITFKNINVKQKLANKPAGIEGDMKITIDALNYGKQKMGNGSLDLNIQGLDKAFISDIPQLALFLDSANNSNVTNTKINIKKVRWHNASGDINFNALIDVDNLKPMTMHLQGIDTVNQFSMKIEAPFAVMARFMSQIEDPESEQITDNQLQKTSYNLQFMAQMALGRLPLITFNKGDIDGIFSELNYLKSKDQVTLNGKTISKEEFLNNLNR